MRCVAYEVLFVIVKLNLERFSCVVGRGDVLCSGGVSLLMLKLEV